MFGSVDEIYSFLFCLSRTLTKLSAVFKDPTLTGSGTGRPPEIRGNLAAGHRPDGFDCLTRSDFWLLRMTKTGNFQRNGSFAHLDFSFFLHYDPAFWEFPHFKPSSHFNETMATENYIFKGAPRNFNLVGWTNENQPVDPRKNDTLETALMKSISLADSRRCTEKEIRSAFCFIFC